MDAAALVALLLVLVALVFLLMGAYAIVLRPRDTGSRVYLALSVLFAFWALTGALRNLSSEPFVVALWRSTGLLSWSLGSALLLHFILVLTRPDARTTSRWTVGTAYGVLLSVGVVAVVLSNALMTSILGSVCYLTAAGFAVVVVSRWGRRSAKAREKKQAKLIAGALLATLLVMVTYEQVLSRLLPLPLPFVFPVFPLIWVAALWLSVTKYGLLDFHPGLAADQILHNVLDLVLLVDSRGFITEANGSAADTLGYDPKDLKGRPLLSLLKGADRLAKAFGRLLQGQGERYAGEFTLLARGGDEVPVRAVLTAVRDPAGEVLGLVASGLNLRVEKQLMALSTTDRLTQIPNRLFLDEVLEYETSRSNRSAQTFSVVLLDLDHFKEVNDEFGHLAGDQVLRGVAQLLRHQLRESDTVGRWGGEEFLLVLPETALSGAYEIAEAIRLAVEKAPGFPTHRITASFGVASWTQGDSVESLVKRADKGLYQAKENGRNRVTSMVS